MSRAWKWILGILAVLVIVAVVAAGVWFWVNRGSMMAAVRPERSGLGIRLDRVGPDGQNFPNGPRGFGDHGRFPFGGDGFRGPMTGNRFSGIRPFGLGFFFLGALLRLIIPLGLLALVAFLFYQLGKRAGLSSAVRHQPVVAPVAPPDQNPPSAA